jgi:hypothetical protein
MPARGLGHYEVHNYSLMKVDREETRVHCFFSQHGSFQPSLSWAQSSSATSAGSIKVVHLCTMGSLKRAGSRVDAEYLLTSVQGQGVDFAE